MRTVIRTDEGVLELNWQWLPTWLGMNHVFKSDLEKSLQKKIVGKPMTDDVLDEVNGMVIDYIEERFGADIDGLRDYLDGLKFVSLRS